MKFIHRDIVKNKPFIELMCVHAYEMNTYLVSLTIGGQQGMVCDSGGRPKTFSSAAQIRDSFAKCKVKQAQLLHDSPYDEMIGNPAKPSPTCAIPFSMINSNLSARN
jgi:hypothetical protein